MATLVLAAANVRRAVTVAAVAAVVVVGVACSPQPVPASFHCPPRTEKICESGQCVCLPN